MDKLSTALATWVAPLQPYLTGQPTYRPCLTLHAPDREDGDWWLAYGLQSASNPTLVIPAAVIWSNPVEQLVYQGHTITHPQETLLAGLGLASRLYAPLEASLNTSNPHGCSLSPIQAYEFLKVAAWRLQDSGVGVVVPPSLARLDSLANRLGVCVKAGDNTLPKGQRIGLNSLLNVELVLTIGNQTLTAEDLKRLTSLGTPLVVINGEWVELRPSDVRAAESFLAAKKFQTTLSLQDILRLSAGDSQVIEKLPVVSFEAGPLQELINTLTGKNEAIKAIEPPNSFRGTLRPYQARGVGWLAFLERWGLGACLADDMGLGKTIQAIAFLLHLQET
ncbi:MAG: ATP-dependent helicase, partial [Cyanobacteria bacterium]|nr:ATP-dependent helicase [Cyanobacteriota bacterium]MDW8203359.1 SNF2 helicase-associated domain-containing protein [Cyanobacteriota bacterium SKYGB_h_bin112]